MKRSIHKTALAVALLSAARAESPNANTSVKPSIQGVWRVVEETNRWRTIANPNPGYVIYTASHFAIVREAQDIKRPVVTDFDKATPEELNAMWAPFVAQLGTYQIKGDVLTMTVLVSKNKAKMGGTEIHRFKLLDANTMTTEPFREPDGKPLAKPIGLRYVRVE